MAVEHYHHHDTTTGPAATDSSAMTVIVALIAVLFIIGLGIFALRTSGYNFGGVAPSTGGTDNGINVDVNPGALPGTTGGAPANP
jgi:hypothetical protein